MFVVMTEEGYDDYCLQPFRVGVVGSRYFDPQYFITRQLTTASDVYSYGVVLLELLTGQKAIDHSSRGEEYNLIEWVCTGNPQFFSIDLYWSL